ncbi:MAG: DUF1206 domain-containing protein [Actinobacteria bacterium]|nr:DUF1206 domain-containing protein [Actinomycetota bacterium]
MGQRLVDDATLERLARAGLAGRGLLYAVLAVLAAQVVLGGSRGSGNASAQGAIEAIAKQPFGRALLIALTVAFAAYAVWRAVQAYRGPREERDLPAWAMRVAFAFRALLYTGLALLTAREAVGAGGGTSSERSVTRTVLEWTGGAWIVAGVGVVVLGIAAYQGYQAISRSFLEDLEERRIGDATRAWLEPLGSAGHAGRALGFGLVGAFIVHSALTFDSGGVGLDGALRELSGTAHGPWLVGAVALGFGLYGAFLLAMVRYAEVRDLD